MQAGKTKGSPIGSPYSPYAPTALFSSSRRTMGGFGRMQLVCTHIIAMILGGCLQAGWSSLFTGSGAIPRAANGNTGNNPQGGLLGADIYECSPTLLLDAASFHAAIQGVVVREGFPAASVSVHSPDAAEPTHHVVTVLGADIHMTVRAYPEKAFAFADIFLSHSTPDASMAMFEKVTEALKSTVMHAKWTLNARGVDGEDDVSNMIYTKGQIDKQRLVSVQSDYQHIEIWQINNNNEEHFHGNDMKADATGIPKYSSNFAERDSSRIMFLDGVAQSGTDDEALYHESLVHPAMIAHPSGAKRVAILGGGEGATLREALKYKSVEEVVMIELDIGVVNACNEHMKQMADCSWTGDGKTYKSCFDDPRTTLVPEDVVSWFDRTFSNDACGANVPDSAKFDVIILDLLDPEFLPDTDFARRLYSPEFAKELSCALRHDGVLVAQLGASPLASDVDPALETKIDVVSMFSKFFYPNGLFIYETYVPTFHGDWSYSIACKTWECANRFNDNAAAVDLRLRQRLIPASQKLGPKMPDEQWSVDGTLIFYDGSVQESMQQTPKSWENLYCLVAEVNNQNNAGCAWRDSPHAEDNASVENPEPFLTLLDSAIDKNDPTPRREATATRDIAEGERLGMYDAASNLVISREQYERVHAFAKRTGSPEYANLVEWLDRYGYGCPLAGGTYQVSFGSLITFVNHGCDASERNVDGAMDREDALGEDDDDPTAIWWDPIKMRRRAEYCAETHVIKPIKKGGGLLEDYAEFDFLDGSLKRKEISEGWCSARQ